MLPIIGSNSGLLLIYLKYIAYVFIRSLGMGSCVFWARVGGMIAPQILLLVSRHIL